MKKTIAIIAITLFATIAHAQTTRCVKNWDGSYTCTTTRNGGF
jgi:hypothetical protein